MESNSLNRIGPKDVFLHLLAIGTLYASAVALNVLLFHYIDYWFPETIRNAFYYQDGVARAIRSALSTLIVVFPTYFFTSRLLRKMYESDPSRKELWIRKWLSYLTMFLAAVVAIGFLIALINTFLNGDYTVAFLLKALSIFFTTGSVFYYYRAVTKGEENNRNVRLYSYFVAAVVFATIVAAFFVAGSPQKQRMVREDNQRVSDLQSIQSYIGEYYRAKEKLPATLEEINDPFRGVTIPTDPVTGNEYAYKLKSTSTFELCADFKTEWGPDMQNGFGGGRPDIAYPSKTMYFGPYDQTWKHSAGNVCFERRIDPDYFRDIPKM